MTIEFRIEPEAFKNAWNWLSWEWKRGMVGLLNWSLYKVSTKSNSWQIQRTWAKHGDGWCQRKARMIVSRIREFEGSKVQKFGDTLVDWSWALNRVVNHVWEVNPLAAFWSYEGWTLRKSGRNFPNITPKSQARGYFKHNSLKANNQFESHTHVKLFRFQPQVVLRARSLNVNVL